MATTKSFGSFFRDRRKAMGLALREFCRRNGFDAGNISRIERGLVPPPQARQILESYAKALKLEDGMWGTFFELAAAGTGRIPDEFLENQQTAQKIPKLLQKLRPQRQTGWVTALHLEAWAATLDARARLPELIRRLVRATGKDIRREEFPKGEQVQRPGWDGIVEAGETDIYVPAGTSVWEMGVDQNPQKKAEEDLAKRTKNSLDLEKKETTFVFVTPRKWQEKAAWCRAKVALGLWKDIRVYDSATLEEWLEQSPAVDAWLAGMLGTKPDGLTVIDEYWANLQAMTDPSLKPEVFLASRDDQVKELEKWLKGSSGALLIDARSPAEAIDFVAAYSRDPLRADLFESRALIVENSGSWRAIIALAERDLILIPHPSFPIEPEMVAEAVRKGHRVLMPCGSAPREQATVITLQRVYRYDLEKALQSSGIAEEKARNLARDAGGSLTVLKRLLGRYPGATQPEWSLPSHAPELIPMLLAGSWDEDSEADRAAMEKLSGHPYSVVSTVADRWLKAYDPPLTRIGTRVSLTSRDDSWFLLGSFVSAESLQRFDKVVCEVLAEDDPSFELPPEERWEAKFYKKVPRHSPALRNGLAETLALLGAKPDRLPDLPFIRGIAEHVVRKLLDGQGWLRWASLSYQLPLLAEAGPEAFLNAVERHLKQGETALTKLFEEAGNALFTSNPHTGFLWALEVLAWHRAYISRVSLILAHLNEMLPIGKSGNNPARSLQEIFMPWFPQTAASVEERVKVLRKLVQSHPQPGWRLLMELLPNRQMASTPTSRPSWRDWALSWSRTITNAAYWQQVEASAALLIEMLGDNVSRWKTLIKHFENLPAPAQKEFIGRLEQFSDSGIDEDARRTISEAIREKVSWHGRFADADWALPAEVLTELETIRSRFEPQDPVRKNAWLFGPRWEVGESLGDTGDQEQRVDEMRRAALREIVDQCGWQGVLQLAKAVEASNEVGSAFADISRAEDESRIVPDLLVSNDAKTAQFAGGYVWRCFRKGGWDWINRLNLRGWSTEQIGRILIHLHFERRTWEFAAQQGQEVEAWYWTHTPPYPCRDNTEDTTYAIDRFLKYKNPVPAFYILRMALHGKMTFEPGLLMNVLQSWLDWVATVKPDKVHGSHYDIGFLFHELQNAAKNKDPRVDLQRLAGLEWAYVGLLDGHPASPVTLNSLLQEKPDFFIEVLGLIFRPKDEPKKEELSETDKRRAENAYRLLMLWKDLPGRRQDQTVDENTLFSWVKEARSLAGQKGLLEVADLRIGEVLAYAPKESDDSWPCIPVRDVLEDIGTSEVFRGFSVGIYNKRGVVCKAPKDGGAQEWSLAERLRNYGQACEIEWPKTAAALRQVAAGYEEEARREDAEAGLD